MVFGIAKVKRIRISAMLSGLKLEADLQNVHTSATHRERVKGWCPSGFNFKNPNQYFDTSHYLCIMLYKFILHDKVSYRTTVTLLSNRLVLGSILVLDPNIIVNLDMYGELLHVPG